MYVLGLILALLAGFHITRNPDWKGQSTKNGNGSVDGAKTSYQGDTRFHREGWALYAGPAMIHLSVFLGVLAFITIIIAIVDFTYAHYIGSVRAFLAFALAASIVGLVVSMLLRSITGETDLVDIKRTIGGGKTSTVMMFVVLLTVVMFGAIALGGSLAAVCVVPLIVLLIILAVLMLKMRRNVMEEEGGLTAGSVKGRLSSVRWMGTTRKIVAMLTLIILIISSFYAFIAPSALVDNDLYASLEENEVRGENGMTLEDPQEVRVVSWLLATQYLERSYGDSASFLDSTESGLLKYTDPSYVNGRFVWVNAPVYESWKWFGGKKVPFFVYVENDPANISEESTRVTHKVELELETHEVRITWEKRLEQLAFDRYAAKYEIAQIRFTIDDEENPFWIVYLARRDTFFNRLYLERILIVNAEDFDDNTEYGVQDEDIPEWLEVVFPDVYVYDWVKFWANYRLGLSHLWFDKSHLYEPDDLSARFIVIQGNTYWQIPLVQKSSHVLGGYVWVDTRTGEATFYNREDHSLADKDTVQAQVQKYLSSGALGFRQLDIHEGYLYPIRLFDGSVREAYVFPLYAGLTVQKYAVVDAEDYTTEPYIDDDLGLALNRYKARSGGSNDSDLQWQEFTISSGQSEGEEAVLSLNNDTVTNNTFVIHQEALLQGLVANAEDEMREVKLAIAAWGRGEDVTIRLVLDGGVVVDADWEGADLVP